MKSTPKTKRFTITLDYDTYQAIQVFSNAVGKTKSVTINQIMATAADSLRALAKIHFEAQTMTESELNVVSKNLSKLADETVIVRNQLTGRIVDFPKNAPV